MGTRVLCCQLGLLLIVLLSGCNGFQLYEENVEGRILCIFATSNEQAFHYHLRLAKLLADHHNVSVIGVLPLPESFQRSKFLYLHMMGTSPDENYKPFYPFTKLYNQWSQYVDFSGYLQRFLKIYPPGKFDLVILAYYFNIKHLMLAGCFKVPIILTTEAGPSFATNWEVGNPREEGYVKSEFFARWLIPNSYLRRSINLFIQRTIEWLLGIQNALFYFLYTNETLHFNCQNVNMDNVRRNISLVFINHHFSQGPIRPNVPAIVEIGGIQIEHPSPLPQYIVDHINSAKNGIIYVNLGKGVKCNDLPQELLDSLYHALIESQRHVLWRWTHCANPRESSKILYTHWMPQSEILALKNVELFITHGSMSSLGEGQYYGVPMLGVTYLSEQVGNVEFLVQRRLALRIDAYRTSRDEVRRKVLILLRTPSFKKRMNHYSFLYRDRQLGPAKTALFWVDYVLRHKGTPYMRSPAADMTQLQMLGLDVIIITLSTLLLIWKLHALLWSYITSRMLAGTRKFVRKYIFKRDYNVVIKNVPKIRYDEAVVDAARECQIRRQATADPDVPRVEPMKASRQRKSGGRHKH